MQRPQNMSLAGRTTFLRIQMAVPQRSESQQTDAALSPALSQIDLVSLRCYASHNEVLLKDICDKRYWYDMLW